MSFPTTFRASIAPDLLDKVTRFYSSSASDILAELIQNARRAGATRIDVEQITDNGRSAVLVRDDGHGVSDPRWLLTLGGSGWPTRTRDREDPAGCGLMSLSARGATIRSRSRVSDSGWTMSLAPEHFTGEAPVVVEPCSIDVTGTEVMFPISQDGESVTYALNRQACYCPVPVYLDGERLEQTSFLEDALHIEPWRGIDIGVVQATAARNAPRINFHGLTLAASALPTVSQAMGGRTFSVLLDIVDCPDLKLVLPARKEVVQDAFFEELKKACKIALYKAIARQPAHALPFSAWSEAKALGIDLPEAKAMLECYRPPMADTDNHGPYETLPIPADAALVCFDAGPEIHQSFHRAWRTNQPDAPLFDPCKAFEGYRWYDRLPRLANVRWLVQCAGSISEISSDEHCGARERPDGITLEAELHREHGDSTVFSLDADLLLCGDPSGIHVDDVGLFVTATSTLTPDILADLLEDAFYHYSDDAGQDSDATQRRRFQEDALQIAISFLLSQDDADRATLRLALAEHIVPRLPRDSVATITIEGSRIDVRLENPSAPNPIST